MTQNEINKIIVELANALEVRDYEKFVSFFADDAIFEIPFSVDGETILAGLPKIKEHFDNIRNSTWAKLIHINRVTTKTYYDVSTKTATVEYFMDGKSQKTEEQFKIQSSIALIQFNDFQITHYKDFPNTIGIIKKAGALL